MYPPYDLTEGRTAGSLPARSGEGKRSAFRASRRASRCGRGTTPYASNFDPANNGFDVQVNGYAVPASDAPSGTGPAIAARGGGGRT